MVVLADDQAVEQALVEKFQRHRQQRREIAGDEYARAAVAQFMRERAFAVERRKMHDAGAGFQRAEEIHRMIRRIAEEQRHRMVLAVAGAQERRGGNLDHRFQLGVADRSVAKFDRRPRAVVHRRLRQQIRQRSLRDRIIPMDTLRIEFFAGMHSASHGSMSPRSPMGSRAVPGMIHYAAAHARQIQREPDTFWLSRHRKGPGMQYVNSIFGELLKPIDRRQFREIVERHNGNAYDKTFKSWDHLVTMVGAQLGGVASLRAVEATFKANSHQHYHLGVSYVPRSTLSRANARRPVGVFAETFAMLAKKADRHTRAEGAEMVRLIDSSPVPLGKMCEWAKWNGRIRGMKMHVVYHPGKDVPRCVEITPATVNDVEIGRQTELDAGATYVFDKGYYHFGWW